MTQSLFHFNTFGKKYILISKLWSDVLKGGIVGDHNVQLVTKFAHLAKIAKICLYVL